MSNAQHNITIITISFMRMALAFGTIVLSTRYLIPSMVSIATKTSLIHFIQSWHILTVAELSRATASECRNKDSQPALANNSSWFGNANNNKTSESYTAKITMHTMHKTCTSIQIA